MSPGPDASTRPPSDPPAEEGQAEPADRQGESSRASALALPWAHGEWNRRRLELLRQNSKQGDIHADLRTLNAEVQLSTLEICVRGVYESNGRTVRLDYSHCGGLPPVPERFRLCDDEPSEEWGARELPAWPNSMPGSEATVYEVVLGDCIEEGLKLRREGLDPAVLNIADGRQPGGSYRSGGEGREEDIFRRTDCCICMDEELQTVLRGYPLAPRRALYPLYGALYTKQLLFRHGASFGYSLMAKAEVLPFISVAPQPRATAAAPPELFETFHKAVLVCEIALNKDHDALVLGAMGCDVGHPAGEVAQIFRAALSCYHGRFRKVVFVLEREQHLRAFQEAFDGPSRGLLAMATGPAPPPRASRAGGCYLCPAAWAFISGNGGSASGWRQGSCPWLQNGTGEARQLHRRLFWHPCPCGAGAECRDKTAEHKREYSHPYNLAEACISGNSPGKLDSGTALPEGSSGSLTARASTDFPRLVDSREGLRQGRDAFQSMLRQLPPRAVDSQAPSEPQPPAPSRPSFGRRSALEGIAIAGKSNVAAGGGQPFLPEIVALGEGVGCFGRQLTPVEEESSDSCSSRGVGRASLSLRSICSRESLQTRIVTLRREGSDDSALEMPNTPTPMPLVGVSPHQPNAGDPVQCQSPEVQPDAASSPVSSQPLCIESSPRELCPSLPDEPEDRPATAEPVSPKLPRETSPPLQGSPLGLFDGLNELEDSGSEAAELAELAGSESCLLPADLPVTELPQAPTPMPLAGASLTGTISPATGSVQPAAPKTVVPQPAVPLPVAPQPVAPKPEAPGPSAAKAVAPEPVAPKTPEPPPQLRPHPFKGTELVSGARGDPPLPLPCTEGQLRVQPLPPGSVVSLDAPSLLVRRRRRGRWHKELLSEPDPRLADFRVHKVSSPLVEMVAPDPMDCELLIHKQMPPGVTPSCCRVISMSL